ncbi:MAG: lytic murein transglycosylase [Desulfuromonadales bacterium]|nr:lytic murein transglycosylase [Desulfuromonadales bacterium]
MKNFTRLILMFLCLCALTVHAVQAQETSPGFVAWLEQLRADARSAGISSETLDSALAGIEEPQQRVLEKDKTQPETTQSLQAYVATRVSEERIAEGRSVLRRYQTWLGRIERQYGVQKRFIVALWGIESSYGRNTGSHPVIPALVTLAYDARRGDYFRKELLDALHILDAGHIPLSQMQGSWAGAMGLFQFMPSSFRHYAVDADGDGRIDIWNSIPDALASAANYLAKAGWQYDQTWGRPVNLPEKFDYSLAGLESQLSLSRWQALGVRRINGRSLPRRNLQASLIIPDGPDGPAYLVYSNFRALRRWNRSNAFAVAVGTLADSYAPQK